MDEEVTIIDSNTRNEKIKNFLTNNKKKIISSVLILVILVIGIYSIDTYKKKATLKLADKYNFASINFKTENPQKTIEDLTDIVKANDTTYSPLALYFLIDNNLIESRDEINLLFDEVINKTKLDKEIKNLNIYKKGLYNSNSVSENELLMILNPLINSESIWKSHALYLVAEYFYSKDEKQKAKDFFDQIITLPQVNSDIKETTQKRLNRDYRE